MNLLNEPFNKSSGKPDEGWKKSLGAAGIITAIVLNFTSPNNTDAMNRYNPDGTPVTIELKEVLGNGKDSDRTYFREWWDDSPDKKRRNLKEKSISYIGQNIIIDWKNVKDLNLNIERIWTFEYSVDCPVKWVDWKIIEWKMMKIIVTLNSGEDGMSFKKYELYTVNKNSEGSIEYDETKYGGNEWIERRLKIVEKKFSEKLAWNWEKQWEVKAALFWDILCVRVSGNNSIYVYKKEWTEFKFIEILNRVNFNKDGKDFWVDVGINGNNHGGVLRFSIEDNPYKNENRIIRAIEQQTIGYTDRFKNEYTELWNNINLSVLNRPQLWKEVYQDDIWYYRELAYKDNWDYIRVMKVYYDENGNIKKTESNKSVDSHLFEEWQCHIDDNWDFDITEDYEKELVKKLVKAKNALIYLIDIDNEDSQNNIPSHDFPGLKKIVVLGANEEDDDYIPNPNVIAYNAIKEIFDINLNNQENLHLIVDDNENITLVGINWEPVNNKFYYQIGEVNYEVSILNWKISVRSMDEPGENPVKSLPKYSGEPEVSNALNGSWLLTFVDKETGIVSYYDLASLKLVAQIPCKNIDGVWTVPNTYSTELKIMDLYNDDAFEAKIKEIQDLYRWLWITDISFINMFKKSLENAHLDFNPQAVRVVLPGKNYWRYYEISNNSKGIGTNRSKWYNTVSTCLDNIKDRLEFLEKINNCKVRYKDANGKSDIQNNIWDQPYSYESGAVFKFITGEIKDINLIFFIWDWWEIVVNYSYIDAHKFLAKLTSKWKTYIHQNRYKTYLENWDLVLEVIPNKE